MPPPSQVSGRTSPIRTRSLRLLFESKNPTMPETSSVVKHSVITTVADVPKFSGEPDTIDLNQYIKRIETLIKNKGIAEENLKTECFKEHIDAVKGTARHVIAYSHLDDIKTFHEYIKVFKKHFTTKSDRDPIRAMVEVLKTTPEQNETQIAYISRLDAQARDVAAIFKNSEWAVKDEPIKITVDNMVLVMMLAHVKSNKGVVQERLYKDIKPNIQLGELDCLLKGYTEIDPACSSYVLAASAESHTHQPHKGKAGHILDPEHQHPTEAEAPLDRDK